MPLQRLHALTLVEARWSRQIFTELSGDDLLASSREAH
eukprot:SAG31_NODE_5005_length_2806_cov_61.751016_3_plen_38_part_00